MFSLLLAGCLDISIGSRRPAPAPIPPPEMPPPAPIVTNPADAATLAEIDAAGRLDFDSSRVQALTQIAERSGLAPAPQVHLVNTAYRCLGFDSSKAAVLQKLIANPAFCDAARQAIVSQLNRLSFDSSRQAILNDVNKRVTGP